MIDPAQPTFANPIDPAQPTFANPIDPAQPTFANPIDPAAYGEGTVTMQRTPAKVEIINVAEKVQIGLGIAFGEVGVIIGSGGPTGTIIQLVASNGTVTFAVDGINLEAGCLLCTLLEDDRR